MNINLKVALGEVEKLKVDRASRIYVTDLTNSPTFMLQLSQKHVDQLLGIAADHVDSKNGMH